MTYAEFKDYCITHLWKMGDSIVIASLDTLIKTAEAELNRTFKVEDRVLLAILSATSNAVAVPDDYREMRSLWSKRYGEMKYLIPAEYANRQACNQLSPSNYTVANRSIRLTNAPTPSAPFDMECWYYANLIPFATIPDGPNWVVEDFFDVYLYTVLKHSAPFLREDERLQIWGALQQSAFDTAIDENNDRKYAGSPLKMKRDKGIR